ncbi:MAG: hypothetical protein LC722_00345 [Actinobacteria bacterium]|nr:hypothetical protein [Actinomycetota bacterium]
MNARDLRARTRAVWPAALVAALLVAGLLTPGSAPTVAAQAKSCPPGYTSYAGEKAAEARGGGVQQAALAALDAARYRDVCVAQKHPEPMSEVEAMYRQNASQLLAPNGAVKAGAFKSAIQQRESIRRAGTSNPAWANRWTPVGKGPLDSEPRYCCDENNEEVGYGTAGLGLGNVAGRITDLEYVPLKRAVYASVALGGVWKTTNLGDSWTSVGDSLPTQVIGSVAWSPVWGGTLLALSGDNSFGRYSYEGFGAFYSRNDGKTWVHARGIPDEAMGFKIAVDPTNPREVYAATGAGLYRSTDGGRSYVNVKLPTGPCAGKSNRAKGCLLANIVTDVAVKHPGGITEEDGGDVVAAVGWRAGAFKNPDGTVQSPNNGIYLSETGARGSFTKQAAPGFASQENIGRTELGAAYGPDQDHNFLYAIVQDAALIKGGVPSIEAPEGVSRPAPPTVLNGIYVSSDFGRTWAVMATAPEMAEPTSGSALAGPLTVAGGFAPGVQAWFNMWIQPDPTQADPAAGAPTRLLFGLEEVWENEVPTPQVGKSQFKVIGRYYAGDSCLFLGGIPACPTDREDALEANSTTHPDQHAAAFIPTDGGGVTLIVGNDGGAYRQKIGPGEDFSNSGWGSGINNGFRTLYPYHAVIAKDGTVWFGLQDNGTARVDPKTGKQVETYGGDGFYVAVDPNNSKIAYEEYVYAAMASTTDGGRSWAQMDPPVTNAQFSNPFVLDPLNPKHLITAGRQVVETGSGAGTGVLDWKKVFDLGTQKHPGDPNAEATGDYQSDPSNTMTALDLVGANAYVGFCSACDVLDNKSPFKNGIATNVGGKLPPIPGSTNGWHMAAARGLPNRYITHVAIDPNNPRTVYATLGGYSRRWTPPNMLDKNTKVGKGHLYVSTNAGQSFRNISGNLPDVRAAWVEVRGDELVVGSDAGVFARKRSSTGAWTLLGKGLPNVPIHSVEVSPTDRNLIVVATHGRGVWTYRFGPPAPYGPKPQRFPKPGKIKGKVIAGPYQFETSDEGWTTASYGEVGGGVISGGVAEGGQPWRRQPPGETSSQSFTVMPYTDKTSSILTSPKIKHAGGTIELSWSELRDTEPDYDYLTIDWSTDGLIWNNALSIDGQNADFPLFSPNAVKFWAPKGDLQVRFRMTSDDLVSFPPYTGVAVDNVVVKI